jgi:hypothetical protein
MSFTTQNCPEYVNGRNTKEATALFEESTVFNIWRYAFTATVCNEALSSDQYRISIKYFGDRLVFLCLSLRPRKINVGLRLPAVYCIPCGCGKVYVEETGLIG